MEAIQASCLCKTYPGGVNALKHLDLQVESGQVFGLLGPNGAGKTTTVRLLNGTLEATSGEARILGGSANDPEIRASMATMAEMARMYEHLSAVRNLEFYAAMYGMGPSSLGDTIGELLSRMGLEDRANDKVGTYSTGMRKRLQLARVLLTAPQLVFLDEPTSGLDPEASREVTELIRSVAQDKGTTVFLCTHNLGVAERVCDLFGFLDQGRLIAYGTRQSLIAGAGGNISLDVVTRTSTHSLVIADESEVNTRLQAIMGAGEQIREVKLNQPDLESLYFRYVGREQHESA